MCNSRPPATPFPANSSCQARHDPAAYSPPAGQRGTDKLPARRLVGSLVLISLALLVAALINSCSSMPLTVNAPLEIPGASYVGNRACFDCHTNYVRQFAASPHARIHLTGAGGMNGQSGCESCHGP